MHWSNPPHLIPVIEVIKGAQTDGTTVETIKEIIAKIGMVAGIVDKDVPGFVENRILYAIMREALHLLDEGVASAQDIDTITKWGIGYKLAVIGPLELLDVAGLDIYTAVASYLNKDLSNNTGIFNTVTKKVEEGKLGLKTQGGFFEYTPEQIAELAQKRDGCSARCQQEGTDGELETCRPELVEDSVIPVPGLPRCAGETRGPSPAGTEPAGYGFCFGRDPDYVPPDTGPDVGGISDRND